MTYRSPDGTLWRLSHHERQGGDTVAVLVRVVDGVEWAVFVPASRLS